MTEPLTITDAAPLIQRGELTPSELLEQCLRRIDIYEPAVKAWVYIDRERARREAEQLTAEIKQGIYRGPLHGIPIGIKDIIDVFDMPTGCGSKLWANSYARQDAECVHRLREAGALILGKTVTTAYAYLDPPVTRNPWNLERTPGGSSSGSAAAVACAMCLAALGTQTGGSVIRPASYCGVCAIKPDWNKISLKGILPLAPNLDHVGIMARCVQDVAEVYVVVSGVAAEGAFTLGRDSLQTDSTRRAIANQDNEPELVPLDKPFHDSTDGIRELFDRTVKLLGVAFNEERFLPPSGFPEIYHHHRVIMSTEAASFHGDRLKRHPEDYPPRIAELVRDGLSTSGVDYHKARVFRDVMDQVIARVLAGSFFITPATPDVAPTCETTGNPRYNSPWSFLHTPVMTIPMGMVDSMPAGLQIISSCACDDDLFEAAAWVERQLNHEMKLPPVPR